MVKVPYERVVQWTAGPVATGIGLGATALVHQNISKATATNVATMIVTTAFTYAAHHKWLTNAAKWWDATGFGDVPVDMADLQQQIDTQDGTPTNQVTHAGAPESPVISPPAAVPPVTKS